MTDGLKPWQLIRRAPLPVWLVTGLFAMVLAGWSVLAPLYHAADEPNHADAVMHIEEGQGWTRSPVALVSNSGIGSVAASPFGRLSNRLGITNTPISASLAPGRHDRPTWEDLQAPPGTSGLQHQQTMQHPPGYYYYEGLLLRAGGAAGWRWDITVSTMRLLSALLIVWLPLLSWATAWRVTGSRLAGIAASIVPLGVPELAHVGATVNNDNLVTLAGAAALLGLAGAMTGDRSKSTALWTGLWTVVALWAKAFGLVLVPLVIGVYAMPWIREWWAAHRPSRSSPVDPERRRRSWLPNRQTTILLALSGGVTIALGSWWYLVSEIRYGSSRPPVTDFPPGKFLGNAPDTFFHYATQAVLIRWWGSFGWYEINLPWRLVVVASIVLALLGIWALIRWQGRRWALLFLLWPTAASYAIVVAQATSNYLSSHYVSGLSGRYLFIGFTGVAAVVGAGCGALPPKLARWSPLVLLLLAIGMQLESLHRAVDHWWRPVGGTLRQAWTSFSAWSTWPVGALWTGIGLMVLFAVASLVALTALGWRGVAEEVSLPPADEQTITIPPVEEAVEIMASETTAPAASAPQPPQQTP